MTTTRKFSSTDVGAPVLTGQNGSLIALLHACLVGTAGVAYGSKAAAGWTEPFINTSTKGVWRNSLGAGATGCYCRVLDDGSIATAAAREANMVAYQAMSDIDTGTDPAPATATLATGVIVRKSNTADATARVWELVADELTWYLNIRPDAGIDGETAVYMAGDIASEVAADAYRYACAGRTSANATTGAQAWLAAVAATSTPASNGLYVGRNYASTGTAISLGVVGTPGMGAGNPIGGSGSTMADPAPGTGNRYFMPALLVGESSLRGRLRGVYAPFNNLTAQAWAATFANPTGLPSGSSLLVAQGSTSSSSIGALCIEQNLPWS